MDELEVKTEEQTTPDNAEAEKLKAELAKVKAALDKVTKEAGDAKKQLRAKQTEEEAAAEAEKEHREAIEKELEQLRKERDVSAIGKKVFTFVQDETVANSVAEALYGAADTDAAVDAFARAWTAREKKLRLDYGRISAPGAGGTDGPTITRAELDKLSYRDRVEFQVKHPEEYETLMGRKK